jgi:uncharacterized protein YbbC (DUF1343 family)
MTKHLVFILLSLAGMVRLHAQPVPAAEQLDKYLGLLKEKRVAMVCNQTSRIGNTLLVDSLLKLHINIIKIFSPEHGFRGDEDAGKFIASDIDEKTKLPIISLYGKNKKPSPASLQNIDVVLFDIQDVGVRFYTYISTLHYVMEACAENNIPLIVLDRPNPLGFYVDGPVLDTAYRSFVGMHPVPLVYGMTMGEYAQMLNGEHWLKKGEQCKLSVILCQNYTHHSRYILPVNPSPNLKNMTSIYLYPSLGLFEGTAISVGRGTDYPFQVMGHPSLKGNFSFSFIPQSKSGAANPPQKGKKCYGIDLRQQFDSTFTLSYIIKIYKAFPNKKEFFNSFFVRLSGDKRIQTDIAAGKPEAEIRNLWKPDVETFKKIRKKYLLYE